MIQNDRYHNQGSITCNSQPAKSCTFRVAKAAPRDRAMAAIRASASEIGRPARRRAAAISAYSRAAALSNGNIRPARSSVKIRPTTASRDCRRFPGANSAMPYSSSASVIVVVNSEETGSDRIHIKTLTDGFGRNVSDSTFVSKTIMKSLAARTWGRAVALRVRPRLTVLSVCGLHRPDFRSATAPGPTPCARCRAPRLPLNDSDGLRAGATCVSRLHRGCEL